MIYPASAAREAFRLRVRAADVAGEEWPGDGFSLEVWSNAAWPEMQASFLFESSYGHFLLWLADMTGDGREEFILVTGEGRGTSARRETLTVYSQEGADFTALTALPFSGYFGPGKRWYYQPTFTRVDGTILELRLCRDDDTNGRLSYPELIPGEQLITIDLRQR